MKRVQHVITKPTHVHDVYDWDDLYDDISTDWQQKAERLQVRRWRKLKRQLI